MFGFKSKRYKKLERINEMIEAELRELQERYNAMVITDKLSQVTKKNVVPLHCSVTVDATGCFREYMIDYAQKEIIKRLVDCIGEYVTFDVRELGRCEYNNTVKYEIVGKVNVVEKYEG